MVDIHCHILPGADDGAFTIEESCMMAKLAESCGVTDIVATPHCNISGQFENYAEDQLLKQFDKLRRVIKQRDIPICIHNGMEIFAAPNLPELLDSGKLLPLGQSPYILIEFALDESERFAEKMFGELEMRNFVPVIAHPERYFFVQESPEILNGWAERGCVIQMNKGSFFGMFGRDAEKTAHIALRQGWVHIAGSDAHSPYRRTPKLDGIYDYLADIAGEETAGLLLEDNPAALLAGREIYKPQDNIF